MNDLSKATVSSLEIADMVEKDHAMLLRDLRRYINQFAACNFASGDFFKESTYLDANNQRRPCFLVTKKGCEFIAHKLTGTKGTIFTAKYINRFHEMEEGNVLCTLSPNIAFGVANLGKVTRTIMKEQGSAPHKIAETFKMQCEQFGIKLPEDFVKVPEYEQMELMLMPKI
ncbi:MAG: Rha family transcriptional regulator [Firmicutes bacterium]|nr:Rha family transcriptional regulator [Bacillota bacterium]